MTRHSTRRTSTWSHWGVVSATLLLTVVGIAGRAPAAPSIFDDDWAPPQREVVTQPKPVTPAAEPASPATPATGPAAAVVPVPVAPAVVRPKPPAEPAPPAQVAARRAVPTKEEAAAARKLMREVYAKELANRTAAARKAFARALVDDAAKIGDAPVDRYVLLGGAFQAATEAQDARVALEAAGVLATAYEVDGRAMKLAALAAAGRAGDADEAKAVVAEGQALIESAVADDDYDTVRKAAAAVELAAVRTRDPAVVAEVRAQVAAARAVADEYARIQKHVATLAARPDDPAANLAVGRFLALGKGDSARGLPALAKSVDPVLAPLAKQDLAAPADPAERAKLGDAWLAVADKQSDLKAAARRRAEYWYAQALSGLEGLPRLAVLKRMRQLPPRVDFDVLARRIEDGVEKTARSGKQSHEGQTDRPRSPGVLVGFDYTLGGFENHGIIKSIRPIFLTADGKVRGRAHGRPNKEWLTIEARPGYAVGAVVADGTNRFNGFKITFMPVRGALLDSDGAYESPWIGGHAAKATDTYGGDGRPAIGVQVFSGVDVDAFGLILAR